jgi:hypothetical protein
VPTSGDWVDVVNLCRYAGSRQAWGTCDYCTVRFCLPEPQANSTAASLDHTS